MFGSAKPKLTVTKAVFLLLLLTKRFDKVFDYIDPVPLISITARLTNPLQGQCLHSSTTFLVQERERRK